MKIAIIGAMDKEIAFLLEEVNNITKVQGKIHVFYEGTINNHQVVIVKAGIGKVASGILISALISHYQTFDLIINIGVSGGVDGKINACDVVVASKLKYADVDVTCANYIYGQMPNCPEEFKTKIELIEKVKDKLKLSYHVGTILTGDQFFTSKTYVDDLINKYFKNDNVLCFDMESTALAQASWFYQIDYLAIRAISDVIGHSTQFDEYQDNLDKACLNSNLFILDVLKNI